MKRKVLGSEFKDLKAKFSQLQPTAQLTKTSDSSISKSRAPWILRFFVQGDTFTGISNSANVPNCCQMRMVAKVAALQADFDIERETFQAQLGTQNGMCSKTESKSPQTYCDFTSVQCGYTVWLLTLFIYLHPLFRRIGSAVRL